MVSSQANGYGKQLGRFPIFQGLTQVDLTHLTNQAMIKTFKKREMLYLQGDPITHVYFLVSGEIKVHQLGTDGNVLTLLYGLEQMVLPHVGLIKAIEYTAFAEALSETTVIMVPIETFRQTMMVHPHIYLHIAEKTEENVTHLWAQLGEKISRSMPYQILHLLLRLAHSYGIKQHHGWVYIRILLSHRDLGQMVGLTRETITRNFKGIKNKGAICYTEDGYLLIHPDRVQQLLYEWEGTQGL